tara:strand:+ start:380 stop:640 length:261 start_codon:yes stop_codon:yes gene_type:complete
MTGKQIKNHIESLGYNPKHDVNALAIAVNKASTEFEHNAFELLKLLIEDKPIKDLMTHSYGFHTASGRHIIETIKEYYYEGVSSSN